MNVTQKLIAILASPDLPDEIRDDAAMDLGDSNEDCAETALLEWAASSEISSTIVSSCGASLSEIWQRKSKRPDREVQSRLRSEAIGEIAGCFRWAENLSVEAPVETHDCRPCQ